MRWECELPLDGRPGKGKSHSKCIRDPRRRPKKIFATGKKKLEKKLEKKIIFSNKFLEKNLLTSSIFEKKCLQYINKGAKKFFVLKKCFYNTGNINKKWKKLIRRESPSYVSLVSNICNMIE